MTGIYFSDLDKNMKTMRTLIQLATTATLAGCLQVSTIGIANAAQPTSNFTNRSTSTVVKVSRISLLENQAKKYEPDPNGNPKSDGTGTR